MDCCCCFTQKKPTCKPRKPNYQKLVDPYVQKYVNFLDKRKERNVPCSVGAVDRHGVKFTIPYPCDKYLPKDTWDNNPCCKKRSGNPQGTEYHICVPQKTCCPKKFTCEQKTCPPPGCQKYLSCKPNPCPGDCKPPQKLICEQKTCPPPGCQKYLSCKPDPCPGNCKPPQKLVCRQKTCPPPCCGKSYSCKPAEPEHCDDAKKLIISVPDGDCTKDIPLGNVRVYLPPEKPPKPCFRQKDYAYRCESRELLGSKLLTYCLCVRRNGLQDDCPRTPCRGRPACMTKPWPDCWPSGGCHGQDYDRVNGVERVNPTLQYRRDNPKCGPCYPPSPDVRLIVEQC